MLAYPALQGNGSLERLPKQTQQPPQGILERAPLAERQADVGPEHGDEVRALLVLPLPPLLEPLQLRVARSHPVT